MMMPLLTGAVSALMHTGNCQRRGLVAWTQQMRRFSWFSSFGSSDSESDSKQQQQQQPQNQLVDEEILQHLVCPISKTPLTYDKAQGVLIAKEINVVYPIKHGVPCLVPKDGRIVDPDN